ncbi:MAG: hypothetical protein ACK4VN_15950 [Bacteroidales bacterium]
MRFLKNEKLQYFSLSLLFFLWQVSLMAQSPTHIPRTRPEPVGFWESTENIVFFIVIPLVIVVLYFLWRRQVKKDAQKKNDQTTE